VNNSVLLLPVARFCSRVPSCQRTASQDSWPLGHQFPATEKQVEMVKAHCHFTELRGLVISQPVMRCRNFFKINAESHVIVRKLFACQVQGGCDVTAFCSQLRSHSKPGRRSHQLETGEGFQGYLKMEAVGRLLPG
jgi:hypothetical protein